METTGLSVSKDEVVEIAAARLVNGRLETEFQAYIANTVDVGDSEQVHGYSNQFFAAKGRPANEVFSEFFAFTDGALLVGLTHSRHLKQTTPSHLDNHHDQ